MSYGKCKHGISMLIQCQVCIKEKNEHWFRTGHSKTDKSIYDYEYVIRLEKASKKLSCILQRIGGSYEIADDMRQEHNAALDEYFEIQRDFHNT